MTIHVSTYWQYLIRIDMEKDTMGDIVQPLTVRMHTPVLPQIN